MILKPRPFRKPRIGHWATKSLAGLWLFNEGTGGQVFDLSGNGNTGTFAGNISWTAGKSGSALNFPGAGGDYVSTSASSSLVLSEGTILLWFKSPAIDGSDYLLDLYIDNNNKAYFYVGAGGTNVNFYGRSAGNTHTILGETYTVDDDKWYQYAITWDSSIAVMYRNAVIVDTESGDERLNWSGAPTLYIGHNNDGGGQVFVGQIDHAMIYNRALSASEISLLYREPFYMFERDPIELWSAATLGAAPPVGMAGAMTTNTGYWGW